MITIETIYNQLWRDICAEESEEYEAASNRFDMLLADAGLDSDDEKEIEAASVILSETAEKMGFYAGFRIACELCQLMGGVKNDG